MKKTLFISVIILFVACTNTNNSNSKTETDTTLTETNMKTQKNIFSDEQKLAIDKTIGEIEEGLDAMKKQSCIINTENDYGDGMFYFYEDGKICKISYEPGDASEYYYFNKTGELIYIGVKEFHYQPSSIEISKFYISDLSIVASYKCDKKNMDDKADDTKIEDTELISKYENNISGRLNSFSKSLEAWPEIEQKLKELAKQKEEK